MAIFWRGTSTDHLYPPFLADVQELLDKSPFDWYVTEGYRSIERSNALYDEYVNGVVSRNSDGTPQLDSNGKPKRMHDAAGRLIKGAKAAPGGKSAHNYGLAIDVVLDGSPKTGLQMLWNTKDAGWLWLKTTTIIHPRLKNGWSFGDWPHIERYKWQQYKGWS